MTPAQVSAAESLAPLILPRDAWAAIPKAGKPDETPESDFGCRAK